MFSAITIEILFKTGLFFFEIIDELLLYIIILYLLSLSLDLDKVKLDSSGFNLILSLSVENPLGISKSYCIAFTSS